MPSVDRSVGALSLPLADGVEAPSLDPARDILLELLTAAINAELTTNWPSFVAGSTLATSSPVQTPVPFEPDPEALTQFSAQYPALFVYRDSDTAERWEDFTLWQRKLTSRWGVDYFLGPLDIGRRGKLQDVLVAVGKIIGSVIDAGGHRAYAETTTPAPRLQVHQKFVLGPNGAGTCGFSTIHLVEFNCGPAQFTPDGPKYWACTATLETTELDGLTNTDPDFDRVTSTLGTGTVDGIVTDLVTADTDDTEGAIG